MPYGSGASAHTNVSTLIVIIVWICNLIALENAYLMHLVWAGSDADSIFGKRKATEVVIVVKKGDTVVDATCRNGYDTLAMLNMKEMVKLIVRVTANGKKLLPRDVRVRLVAFNLGYLPGGDKTLITKSDTTRLAMEVASRIVASGGLISMLVYVGHPGGMEEYDTVEGFASQLSVNDWICCKLQMLNRPLAPILVLLCKR
ncbi:putative rRNA methylase YtqB isoform X1 [Tanacetum coccineum]